MVKLKTNNMKIACTGTSGSGKTTLVKFIAQIDRIEHISGSAGDIKTSADKDELYKRFGHLPHSGHLDVIQRSAEDVDFGFTVQDINRKRRDNLIRNNDNFVTDRSPLDNLTYFVNQIGFHPPINDFITRTFAEKCLETWNKLTHVIYIKAVQPYEVGVENNGSRVPNWWYQKAIDAQFEFWLKNYFIPRTIVTGPRVMIINYWDWETRKKRVLDFLKQD